MNTKRETYQGWKNYETWAVNLWLSNEKSTYRYWQDQVKIINTSKVDDEQKLYDLADLLRENIEDHNPLNVHCTVYSDLLNAAISEVDWSEIAKELLQENK